MLKSAVVAILASLVCGPLCAREFERPIITLSEVNWDAAAASLPDRASAPSTEAFARLNAVTGKRFVGIEKSSVPVLLPFDVDGFRKDVAAGNAEASGSDKYFGQFHPTKFFLPGPAGYDATFIASGFDTHFAKPIVVEITGAAFVYALDGPNHIEKELAPSKELTGAFPGVRRVLSEAHLRYVFERFGVPYVVSIQCYDQPGRRWRLSCNEAEPVALAFLRQLRTAGGTPGKLSEPLTDLRRPSAKSDFTYYSPGDLIQNSGWDKLPGRVDYHVYARMRFPIASAPAYVKSQSFMPWGDCYRSGIVGRLGRKDAEYRCRRNEKQLVFNEAAAENFTYPWRDNFCELRDWLVGQCPGGYGHQGEDIRPAQCTLKNAEADRCLPYQDHVAAVQDGMIRRMPGNLGAYIVVNTADEHVRFRYLHMNPRFMDADGLLDGRQVSEGEIIGKVATWGDFENGTSYHLNFNIQVFTSIGWVWVNPYTTLVAAYERQIGGRGTEIEPGEPPPPVPPKLPVVLKLVPPAQPPSTVAEPPAKMREVSFERAKLLRRRHFHSMHHRRRHEASN
ncbi:MAG TPA: M23 family peptidase [Pseudolabrys sp.]|nr:M23 family peptidase [Pseudolabrys sp.]